MHMNESCHTWNWAMSHVIKGHNTCMYGSCHTYVWVMSHVYELFFSQIFGLVWSHVKSIRIALSYVWHDSSACMPNSCMFMTRLTHICDDSNHIYMSHSNHTYECIIVYVSPSNHMYECYTYERFLSTHYWMSLGIYMNASCHTYEWGMSHLWIRHSTLLNESCYKYECVMSPVWMRYITHINMSWHNIEWVLLYIWMCHVPHTYQCVVTQSEYFASRRPSESWHTHCNTLQHTATHCNTLPRTATHCNTLQHTTLGVTQTKRVAAHTWMSHGTYLNASRDTYKWVMAHTYECVLTQFESYTLPSCESV